VGVDDVEEGVLDNSETLHNLHPVIGGASELAFGLVSFACALC